MDQPILVAVIVLSEAVALWLVVRVWRSHDPLVLKVALSLLAAVPVLGPIAVGWIASFPPPLPHELRDHVPRQADVFSRFRPELERRRLMEPFQAFRVLLSRRGKRKP